LQTEREPQGGEEANAELDGQYKRLRRLGAKLAHKAQWHGFQPICIANTPSAVRCEQRTSDCYEVNRVSVAPREADAVGSLKVCRGGTAVGETREEGGKLYFFNYSLFIIN